MTWLCYVPIYKIGGHQLSWGAVMLAMYSFYYVNLDLTGGVCFAFLGTLMYFTSTAMIANERNAKGTQLANFGRTGKIALGLHLLSWYMQIHPGHGIYEGTKPALLDSVSQAFSVAPLFAFYEGLWFAGMQQDLKREVVELVNATRAQMCAAGGTYGFCSLY
eukprot:CAMPEP_0119474428 /NCGR_PEP_ID=MMETSP1344-20130328/5683_1 /TAXON_ID=236787 /ORGANISM="Florenciella parvula, Strain CCMP2471" /LENGTH=161 /DNA_ID=CAMNT_0007507719 /DNA_START=190 /DNA_END=675 /DNA_ORIENTATION=-